ncbi:DUF6470 family protein [Oceanobacillus sp. CAU 1775]
MRVPQIRMESQFAKIQINQTDAKVHIKQELPKMQIQQPHAEVSIRTTPSKLSIDQTRAWEDMDLMSILRRNDKFAAEGMQAVKEGTARVAREGREMMSIENGGNPFAAQAKRINLEPMKELGIKFIPSHFSVKTDYQPSEVHINVETKKPIIQAQTFKPQFNYEAGGVETSLLQKNYLNISFENI